MWKVMVRLNGYQWATHGVFRTKDEALTDAKWCIGQYYAVEVTGPW
jgi:hypothetical protein